MDNCHKNDIVNLICKLKDSVSITKQATELTGIKNQNTIWKLQKIDQWVENNPVICKRKA